MSTDSVARFRARQREQGLTQVAYWVRPEDKAAIAAYIKGLPPPPTVPTLVLGSNHGAIKLDPSALRVVLTALRDHLTNQPHQQPNQENPRV